METSVHIRLQRERYREKYAERWMALTIEDLCECGHAHRACICMDTNIIAQGWLTDVN